MSGVPSQRGRIGTVISGKWRVDARIGSGGMSTVYSATHKNNGSRAALKILHPDLARDEEIKSRFLREGYVANQVSHPGIVMVVDDDVSEAGDVYLVVELLEGQTLEAARTAQNSRLPYEKVITYSLEALDALAAAHGAGIIHRDLKPDNLFLTKADKIKILDFGLARLLEGIPGAENTRTGVMIGTPEFMAPEQAAAQRDAIDAQSDVWGMGATMYTLMTGKHVHDAHSLREHLIAAATRRAEPVRKLAPWIPEAVAAVIDKAIQFDKPDRWPHARAMEDALAAARGAAPMRPRAMSRPEPTAPMSPRSGEVDVVTSAPAIKGGARPAPREREPAREDDTATLMTQTTQELRDRMSEPVDVNDDTVIAPPSSKNPYPFVESVPNIPISEGPAPTPRMPLPTPPPPRPRTPSHSELSAGPSAVPRPSPIHAFMDQGPVSHAPRGMARPPMGDFSARPSAPMVEQITAPKKRSSWGTIALVALFSLLLAAGGTVAAMRYAKKR